MDPRKNPQERLGVIRVKDGAIRIKIHGVATTHRAVAFRKHREEVFDVLRIKDTTIVIEVKITAARIEVGDFEQQYRFSRIRRVTGDLDKSGVHRNNSFAIHHANRGS
jgi:hypothetical protein